MNVKEAATALGISTGRVRQLIGSGRLTSTKDERGYHVIDQEALDLLSSHRVESMPVHERVRALEERVERLKGVLLADKQPGDVEPAEEPPVEKPEPELEGVQVTQEPEPPTMTPAMLIGTLQEADWDLFKKLFPIFWTIGMVALFYAWVDYYIIGEQGGGLNAWILWSLLTAIGQVGLSASVLAAVCVLWKGPVTKAPGAVAAFWKGRS